MYGDSQYGTPDGNDFDDIAAGFAEKVWIVCFGQFAQGSGEKMQNFAIFCISFATFCAGFAPFCTSFAKFCKVLATFPKTTPIFSLKMTIQNRHPEC